MNKRLTSSIVDIGPSSHAGEPYKLTVRKFIPPRRLKYLLRWLNYLGLTEGEVTLNDIPEITADGIFLPALVQKLTNMDLNGLTSQPRTTASRKSNIDVAITELWKHGPNSYFMSTPADIENMTSPAKERSIALINEAFTSLFMKGIINNFSQSLDFISEILSHFNLKLQNFPVINSNTESEVCAMLWESFGAATPLYCLLAAYDHELYAHRGYSTPHLDISRVYASPLNASHLQNNIDLLFQALADAGLPIFFSKSEWLSACANQDVSLLDGMVLQIDTIVTELMCIPEPELGHFEAEFKDSVIPVGVELEARTPRQKDEFYLSIRDSIIPVYVTIDHVRLVDAMAHASLDSLLTISDDEAEIISIPLSRIEMVKCAERTITITAGSEDNFVFGDGAFEMNKIVLVGWLETRTKEFANLLSELMKILYS